MTFSNSAVIVFLTALMVSALMPPPVPEPSTNALVLSNTSATIIAATVTGKPSEAPASSAPTTPDAITNPSTTVSPINPTPVETTVQNNNKIKELSKSLTGRPGSLLVINSPNSTFISAVRFDGELIHRYVKVGQHFQVDDNSPQRYSETREHFPANVTAAVAGPEKLIYFFRGNKFCKRTIADNTQTNGCSQWYENRDLFGCNATDLKDKDICLNPTIDGMSSVQNRTNVRTKYIFKGKEQWVLKIDKDLVHGHITLVGNNTKEAQIFVEHQTPKPIGAVSDYPNPDNE